MSLPPFGFPDFISNVKHIHVVFKQILYKETEKDVKSEEHSR